MSDYVTAAGDTFELVSRKVYGEELQATRIAEANPGVTEPLAAGVTLTIPDALNEVQLSPNPQGNPNEVSLLINEERFTFWERVSIRRAIDSVDTVNFSAPFEADSAKFRETFKPFAHLHAAVTVGGVKLFTGFVIGIQPQLTANRRSVQVSGYARPGILFDCTAAASSFPLEYEGQRLPAIAAALASPFGVAIETIGNGGAAFERVALNPDKVVGSFLADLAKQRGLVLSSTGEGKLLIWESEDTGTPVAVLQQGAAPVVSVEAEFKPQKYFTSITALDPVSIGNPGGKYTARNKFAEGGFRPYTFEAKDTESGNVKAAAEAKLGRMFGEVASYKLSVNTWRTPSGDLWAPNTTISLDAPGAMIYGPYSFLVRAVTFNKDSKSETAELELVLPGAYNGKQPEALPWN